MFKIDFFFLIAILFFSCLFFNAPSFADSEKDKLQHPFFLSVSGSGGASLSENLSYLINPSLLAFYKRKKAGLAYSFKNKNQTAVLSLVDNKINLPVALTYQRWWYDSFKNGTQNKLFLSSGFKLTPYLSLGFNVEKNLESPFSKNVGIGSFLRLNSQIGLALFLDKALIEKDQNLRVLNVSGSYRWKNFFSIQSDLSKSAKKDWILRGGVESLFHPLFSFQLGGLAYMEELNFQEVKSYLLSGGLSFLSPKFVLKYGLQSDSKNYQHSFTCLIRI